MTDHERLREQYEDALFALLMEGVAESEGEEALRLNEELKKDPNAEVPKDVQKRCEKTIRSAFAQKQLRATGRTAARWLTKVAVVAVLGGLMFTAAFALSEDVRVATLNALIQVMDDRTEITFEGIQTEGQQPPSETVSGLDYHYNPRRGHQARAGAGKAGGQPGRNERRPAPRGAGIRFPARRGLRQGHQIGRAHV